MKVTFLKCRSLCAHVGTAKIMISSASILFLGYLKHQTMNLNFLDQSYLLPGMGASKARLTCISLVFIRRDISINRQLRLCLYLGVRYPQLVSCI